MTIEKILEDLISNPGVDPGGRTQTWQSSARTDVIFSAASPERVVLAFERECNLRYKNPGSGIHFVGSLLTVFAAEVISAYWRGVMSRADLGDGKGVRCPTMLSCVYSDQDVKFVLSHASKALVA